MSGGNDKSVMYTQAFDRKATFAAADAHCAKYGRKARLLQIDQFNMSFDCVPE